MQGRTCNRCKRLINVDRGSPVVVFPSDVLTNHDVSLDFGVFRLSEGGLIVRIQTTSRCDGVESDVDAAIVLENHGGCSFDWLAVVAGDK